MEFVRGLLAVSAVGAVCWILSRVLRAIDRRIASPRDLDDGAI